MNTTIKFYEFSHNSSYTRGFTWAASIYPRSEVVHYVCQNCGSVKHYPRGEFDVALEGGTKYPDVLGCGAYPFLIVTENVVLDWKGAGVTSFEKFKVGIASIKSKSPRFYEQAPPKYFRIEITGSCEIDLEASGLEVISFCQNCGHFRTKPAVASGFQMVEGSWDGSFLFRDIIKYPHVTFCTLNILELAHRNHHTNFRFEPMGRPRNTASKGIDYLKGHFS
jgi:hypothetical protein